MTVSLLLVLFSVYVEMYKQREGENAKEGEMDRERHRQIVRTILVRQE